MKEYSFYVTSQLFSQTLKLQNAKENQTKKNPQPFPSDVMSEELFSIFPRMYKVNFIFYVLNLIFNLFFILELFLDMLAIASADNEDKREKPFPS